MRRALLLLAACGGGEVSTSPPPDLPFVTQTIQLQPDSVAPRWTMRVPAKWAQDPNLVGNLDGQERLVNGAGEPLDREEAATSWEDLEGDDGMFELSISCRGDCAQSEEKRILGEWHGNGNEVIEEHETATEHTLAVREKDHDIWVMRFWYVPGDTRFHSCAARVAPKYARYWRAYARSCADVIESPTSG